MGNTKCEELLELLKDCGDFSITDTETVEEYYVANYTFPVNIHLIIIDYMSQNFERIKNHLKWNF